MEYLRIIFLALIVILPVATFSVFTNNERKGLESWRPVLGVIMATLAVMFAFYLLIVDKNDLEDMPIIGNDASELMNLLFVALTSLVPVAAYWIYIRGIDSAKAEPWPILLLTTALGVFAAAGLVIIDRPLFLGGFQTEVPHSLGTSLNIGFLELAVPAELMKWLILVMFFRLNHFYDEYIDGVVYSVCLSLGFAAVLGTWFVYDFADFSFWLFFKKGVVTALILIPIHFMSGACMGYFFGLSRKKKKVLNYMGALIAGILVDGIIWTILVMMGVRWMYYFLIGIILSILSILFYRLVIHLLRMDGVKIE